MKAKSSHTRKVTDREFAKEQEEYSERKDRERRSVIRKNKALFIWQHQTY